MSGPIDDCESTTTGIFVETVGDRATRLDPTQSQQEIIGRMSKVLAREFGPAVADDIGFHLSDWVADAAFLVALHLFPERFSDAEVEEGIESFLLHAPNHVAAAAALTGNPIEDVFEVGALWSQESE